MPTAAMASPPVMMPLHRDTSTMGMDGIGMPAGTSPTTRTPLAARSSWVDTTMPPTSTMSDHGTRGARREPPKRTARLVIPTTSVRPWKSPESRTSTATRSRMPPVGVASPARAGISPTTMSTTRPATNPVTIGSLRNWATQPSRSRPTSASTTPAVIASTDVSCTASSGLPPARARTIEPDSTDTVEIGPTKSSRGGAEQGVGEQGRWQRVEADLYRYAGDDRVAERLGDGQGGDEQAGEDVGR